jgi:hypothetical protein
MTEKNFLFECSSADFNSAAALQYSLQWWRSEDGAVMRCYSTFETSFSFGHVVAIEPIVSLEGKSIGETASHHYIVETDVAPGAQAELNDWYAREHLPGLAAVPGTVRAQRFLRTEGRPLYIACYDLSRVGAMQSDEWLAVRHTAWSDRVRPMFRNTRRTLFAAFKYEDISG